MSSRRTSSSLYPNQWGSGREVLDLELIAYSYECVDWPDHSLRYGDKIILAPEILRQVSRAKLPFPLFFYAGNVRNAVKRRKDAETCKVERRTFMPSGQYCGVLEFSAPKDTVYMPRWIMKSLRIKEGERVHLMSISQLVQGTFVQLQPDSMAVVDVLAKLGPKYFLEQALRNYATLSAKRRIVINHENEVFGFTVLVTKPHSKCVSILGAGDLEVDFAEPKDKDDHHDHHHHQQGGMVAGAPAVVVDRDTSRRQQKPPQSQQEEEEEDDPFATSSDLTGMGWATGGAVEELQPTAAAGAADNDNDNQEDEEATATTTTKSWFFGTGHRLTNNDEDTIPSATTTTNEQQCEACCRWIPAKNFTTHTVHCARAFERCPVCAKRLPGRQMREHRRSHTMVSCDDCGERMEQGELAEHRSSVCASNVCACTYCGDSVPVHSRQVHEEVCGEVEEVCDVCQQMVARSARRGHQFKCTVVCGECGETIRNVERQHHQQTQCSQRMMVCSFCQLSHKAAGFQKHVQYCGSRTEQCDTCSRWIQMREMAVHVCDGGGGGGGGVDGVDEVDEMENDFVQRRDRQQRFVVEEEEEEEVKEAAAVVSAAVAVKKKKKKVAEAFPCPNCQQRCRDFEQLQMHMLTKCSKRASATAKAALGMSSPQKQRLAPVRPGSARIRRSGSSAGGGGGGSSGSIVSVEAMERAKARAMEVGAKSVVVAAAAAGRRGSLPAHEELRQSIRKSRGQRGRN